MAKATAAHEATTMRRFMVQRGLELRNRGDKRLSKPRSTLLGLGLPPVTTDLPRGHIQGLAPVIYYE